MDGLEQYPKHMLQPIQRYLDFHNKNAVWIYFFDNEYELQKCDALHHTNMMVFLTQAEISQEQVIEYLKKNTKSL